MTMPEVLAVEQWLTETLEPLGVPVWSDTIPDDEPYPCILFSPVDTEDINSLNDQSQRIMSRFEYAIRVWDETRSFVALASLADDLDDALQGQAGEADAGFVLSCVRTSPLAGKEQYDGVWYSGLGGVYRIIAQGKEA